MKTCTVTFYYSGNFGAFLQTWALQRFLGESNTLLYFNPSDVNYRFYIKKNSRWRKIPFFWRFLALYRYIFQRRKIPDNVCMLRHTRKYYSLKELIKNPPEADVYIAGSDQIWNSKKMFYDETNFEPYFLGFGSPNTKRIAYAASMGGKEWPVTYTQKVLPYLRKFHAISVREESSVPFLNSIGLENVAVTCDPTILWTADVYRAYFHLEENKHSENIFIYRFRKYPVSVQQFLNGKKTIEFVFSECKQVPVSQWLYNISNAEFVITDSFHGTVFSILFHKPFIIFPIARKNAIIGNERFHSLLKKINLQYRLLSINETETKEEVEKILYSPIDWEQVDRILEEWRIYSANWLRSALEN